MVWYGPMLALENCDGLEEDGIDCGFTKKFEFLVWYGPVLALEICEPDEDSNWRLTSFICLLVPRKVRRFLLLGL